MASCRNTCAWSCLACTRHRQSSPSCTPRCTCRYRSRNPRIGHSLISRFSLSSPCFCHLPPLSLRSFNKVSLATPVLASTTMAPISTCMHHIYILVTSFFFDRTIQPCIQICNILPPFQIIRHYSKNLGESKHLKLIKIIEKITKIYNIK